MGDRRCRPVGVGHAADPRAGAVSVWFMQADAETHEAIQQLVNRTYQALSAPGGDLAEIFGNVDLAVAGSGLGELMQGPDEVVPIASAIAAQRMSWVPEQVTAWRRRGDRLGSDSRVRATAT